MKRTYSTPSSIVSNKKRTPYKGKLLKRGQYFNYKTQAIPKVIGNAKIGFPTQLTIKQLYSETGVLLTSTVGSFASYVMSANGLFDPNITAAGHQPSYFDTLTTLYNHYNVIASKCTFTFANSQSITAPMNVLGTIEDNATPAVIMSSAAEQANSSPVFTYAGSGQQPVVITLYWNAKKFFGPDAISNTQLQGSSSSNPAEQSYFIACAQATGGATASVYVNVEIEYTAVWRELKDIAQS